MAPWCAIVGVLLLSAACTRRAVIGVDPAGLRRDWTLVQLRDSAGDAALAPESRVTLRFLEDGRVGGRASINQFGGSVELRSDGSMSWSSLTSTLMAGPPELMAQERRFLAALQATNRYRLDGKRLTLSDSASRVELRFTPSDTTGGS